MRLVLVIVACLAAAPAFACSCLMPTELTAGELKAGDLVLFIGRVVKTEPIPTGHTEADAWLAGGSRTTFLVQRHWEEGMESEVLVESGFAGGGCGYVFEKDQEYVVFASTVEKNPGTLTTSICTRTAPLERAAPLVRDIERLIGTSRVPEPPREQQLITLLKCDAHIVEGWRRLEAKAFRGHVETRQPRERFPGALVAVRMVGGEEIFQTRADEQGRFRIDGLQEGLYEFVVCSEGMDPDMGWITITPRSKVGEVTLFLRYGV